jgi:hypothetical protein
VCHIGLSFHFCFVSAVRGLRSICHYFLPDLSKVSPLLSSFRGSSFRLVPGPNIPDDAFPTPCHSCTVSHLSTGDSQSLLGFATPLNPTLRFLVAPCGQIPVPTPLPQSSGRHHCGFFLWASLCSGKDCIILESG